MDECPRVLIVEDEPRLRDLLCDVLPGMGFAPIAVRAAEPALAHMQRDGADVILLDLNLPVMDGLTFLERFRERWPDTPVVIMTGFGDLSSARRAIQHGVSDFLSKPFHLSELETALGRAKRLLHEQRRLARVTEAGESGESSPASAVPGHPGATLADLERCAILDALRRHQGNRTAAAAELGISRRTLYNKLSEYEKRGESG